MIILITFAFIAGFVTILSPCILPILPIVLSSSLVGGKKRSLGIVAGFILSFTFFTLALATIVSKFGIDPDTLRLVSVAIILLFGISLLLPKFQAVLEQLFVRLARFTPKSQNNTGFLGGIIVGASIGLVWTPCVGPILASVISLALTGSVSSTAIFVTLSYSLGTAIPMIAIVYGGRNLLNKVPLLTQNTVKIQKLFGAIMIITAFGICFGYDRIFQSYILTKFPNYGTGLTKFEDNSLVDQQLQLLGGEKSNTSGELMFDVLNEENIKAPELIPGGVWFNTSANSLNNLSELAKQGKALESLRGKVVLIDFWTYTCINCIRTLPYLKDWDTKYKDEGLVIIGVHTPEFEFEKSAENVQKAIDDFDLKYTVMQDNDYKTWRAYANRYWPAKYLIDKNGKIVYTHFGEGDYDETEKQIQKYLKETGATVNQEVDNPTYQVTSRSPETYLGYGRMEYFATPSQLKIGVKFSYILPDSVATNRFAFGGSWQVEEERSQAFKGAQLVQGFDAMDVFLVMRSVSAKPGKVKVYLDDKLVDETSAGEDVVNSEISVDKDRLYKLIHLQNEGKHTLKLEFEDDNVEVYAFTFG
jgi:cytochrome c biogenesis protein CcdA/thiol-disulfide isomerase/thioredoxin